MFYHCHAAPALLLLMICAALPNCIMSQCSSYNLSSCTSCSSCTSLNTGGLWYSTNGNNCGASGVSGGCVRSYDALPCATGGYVPFYYSFLPSYCNYGCQLVSTVRSCCTSSTKFYCLNCAECTNADGVWSTSSSANPSSGSYGKCVSDYSAASCPGYVFTRCTSTSSSYTYKTCSYYGYYGDDGRYNTVFYVIIVAPLVIWFINIIAIAVVARRKGLNPCMYIILAVFFSVFAWFCLCCGSNQTGGQALIGHMGSVEFQNVNVQAPGNFASVSDPYSANVSPNPYGANAVQNPYGANAVQNPYGQSPAPAPDGNAAPEALNPYAYNSGAASAPPCSSPQPAAFDQYRQNLHTNAYAQNSQTVSTILPY